ncbi:hypothetical protein [Luteolibacter sp. LG18]|uniref:hypothetical protein n=1 Tax=Luteolibacter sp. LG18 TaxID=2819286 RepID=UPI002B2A06BC|nr:hypothetical protein llg_13210 [Luteolibacter sp. LG18]
MSDSISNVFVLSRINKALRADFQHLTEADSDLHAMLGETRAFGERALPSVASDAAWRSGWEKAESLLSEIRLYTGRLGEELESESTSPLVGFDVVVARDEALHETLHGLSSRLDSSLDLDDRADWRELWQSVEGQLDVIRAYLAAARTRVETRRKHGEAEAQRLHQEVLSHLPADSSLEDSDRFSDEYERAFQQFQRDKHRTGGLIDIFKGLLLIQEEGPEAKIRRRLHEPTDG